MAINAGSLRHRLVFLNSQFQYLHNPANFYWGSFRTLRGLEKHEAQLIWQTATAEIRTRYFRIDQGGTFRDPALGDHIEVDGVRRYRIQSITNVDEKDEEYVFVVSEV